MKRLGLTTASWFFVAFGRCGKYIECLPRFHAVLLSLLAFSLPVHAAETSLSMTSDLGDYIGGGQTYFYTPADGVFSAQANYGQGVSISFNTSNYSHWWHLDFAAPYNTPLTVGSYTGAVRFPFQGSNLPGLSVYGDGRGCNTLTGTFQVLEVIYGVANDIQSFDATFEQHCEGSTTALRGQVRYNASLTNVAVSVSAPLSLTAPAFQNLMFTVTATDAQSRHVVLTAQNMPAGATFVDNGNNTGTFSWTPMDNQIGSYLVSFVGDNQQGNTSTAYTSVQVPPPPVANDNFEHATVVSSIPFTATEDVSNATTASNDMQTCYSPNQSVWFAFTAQSNMRIEVNTFGSNYDTTMAVFTGASGALTQIGCNDDSNGALSSRTQFDAVAGATYYFMVSSLFTTSNANLVFNLMQGSPPFTFSNTVNRFGTVSPNTGAVTIRGTVVCSVPTYASITGDVKQVRGGVPISGWFQTMVPCNGTTTWSATVQSANAVFHGRSAALFTGGSATVNAWASAMDADTGELKQTNLQAKITLRGK